MNIEQMAGWDAKRHLRTLRPRVPAARQNNCARTSCEKSHALGAAAVAREFLEVRAEAVVVAQLRARWDVFEREEHNVVVAVCDGDAAVAVGGAAVVDEVCHVASARGVNEALLVQLRWNGRRRRT